MTDLLKLATRCEIATGFDRELDAEIALAVGYVTERDGDVFYGHKDYSCMVLERGYYDRDGDAPELPHFTISFDAALLLILNGLHWTGQTDGDEARMTVGKADSDARGIFYTNCQQGVAKTAARALCAAALRAKTGGAA